MSSDYFLLAFFVTCLLLRHVPQVLRDVQNAQKSIVRSITATVRAEYLIAVWSVIHGVTILSIVLYGSRLDFLTLIGTGCFVTGCVIGLVALVQLGQAYHLELVITTSSTLVDRGLYSVIRHPLRLGLALETLGATMISGISLLLMLWALLVYFQVLRSREEDVLLVDYFGEHAGKYRQRVPAVNVLCGLARYVWQKLEHLRTI